MKISGLSLFICLFICCIFCSVITAAGLTEQDFKVFLKDYEAKVIPLTKESSLSYFIAVNSGKDEDYEKSTQVGIALDKIFSDTAAFRLVKAFRESSQVKDSILKRELDIIYLDYLGRQIDSVTLEELIKRSNEIEQRFNTYRVKVGENSLNDNQVDSIMRSSSNSAELEQIWKASKLIGREVKDDLITLVKLRNKAAKSLGFSNFYEMQIKLSEQDPAEVVSLFAQLDSLTRGAYAILKDQIDSALSSRLGIPKSQLQPWHYQDRFFQSPPSIYDVNIDRFYQGKDPVEISRKYYAGIGLPVDSIIAGSDLYERPGKYQHAQCCDIDQSGDVRVICSVRPDYYWMNTMLHELGHGVYSYYNDPKNPWLLREAAHSLTTEAIANFFGRLGGNRLWIKNVVGVPSAEVDRVAGDYAKVARLEQLVFSRWAQVILHFERNMYENPDQDLNKLWWDLVEKYQGLKRPAGRENEPDWASKIHIAVYPVYYHNYLMGELFASQLTETIGRKILKSSDPYNLDFANDPRIGQYLIENVFHPGRKYPWNEMIRRATGEPLTATYYAKQFIDMK